MLVKLEFGDVGFCRGGKTGVPRENRSEQGESHCQTQPTYDYDTGQELNPDHTIPAPRNRRTAGTKSNQINILVSI